MREQSRRGRLARLLRTKQRNLSAVTTLQISFVNTFNESEAEDEEEEFYERRGFFADIVEACPNVEHLSLDTTDDDDTELGPRLLNVIFKCNLSSFTILGFCAIPEQAMIR